MSPLESMTVAYFVILPPGLVKNLTLGWHQNDSLQEQKSATNGFFIQKVSFLESPPLSDKSWGKNALLSHCYSSSLVNMAFFTLKKNNLSPRIKLFAFQMEYIRIINHKWKAMNQNCHLNTSYVVGFFSPQYSLKWLLHENESSDNQHKGLI